MAPPVGEEKRGQQGRAPQPRPPVSHHSPGLGLSPRATLPVRPAPPIPSPFQPHQRLSQPRTLESGGNQGRRSWQGSAWLPSGPPAASQVWWPQARQQQSRGLCVAVHTTAGTSAASRLLPSLHSSLFFPLKASRTLPPTQPPPGKSQRSPAQLHFPSNLPSPHAPTPTPLPPRGGSEPLTGCSEMNVTSLWDGRLGRGKLGLSSGCSQADA